MAFASPRVSRVEHGLSLLPGLEERWCLDFCALALSVPASSTASRPGAACPSVVIMDGQSVKTTERGGIRGFDAHKRVKGRKRHILVDTFGLLIACRVEPADISDRKAAARSLGGLRPLFPNIRTVIADAGHQVANSRTTCCAKTAGSCRSSNAGSARSRSQASHGLWSAASLGLDAIDD